MNYSEFLMANLLVELNSDWNDMPYDEVFDETSKVYKEFVTSSYNDVKKDLYGCIEDWIIEVYNKK